MNIEALCHIPKSNYAYAYREKEIHIRIRTAKNDMSQVNIIYSVKYDWANKQKHTMKKILTDQYYDYYQYEIIQEDTRIGYYFELISNSATLYYTEMGMVTKFNDDMAYCYYFQYPYLNSNDLHKIPSWVNDTIFYEIFVDRFYNGNKENSPLNLSSWGDVPTAKSFFGGDLKGILEKLDYIEDLGINAIYLTPIFQSPSNHKYDIVNFFEVDPYFGDKEILNELVAKAHEKGIKIILDAVFNHCSESFPQFIDVMNKGNKSEYYDWFYIDGDSVKKDPPNYRMFGFVSYMPKLNTNNLKVREYLLKAVRYWTVETGIDGWRLDVSDEIDHVFWREFRTVVKEINPEAIIIGENWHNAYSWLMGDQFDGIMNYSVTKLCVDYFAKGAITSKVFEQMLSTYLIRYPEQVNDAMLNLLDSHDTERFLYSAGEDKNALKNATAFLLGYKGMPCVYYGTEIGLTGNYDPGCRRTFNWCKENWDMDLYQYYKQLIKIRRSEKALKQGKIEFLSTDYVFVMKREYEKELIYIIINTMGNAQEIIINEMNYTKMTDLIKGQKWELDKGTVQITIPERTAFYMKFD